METIFSEHNISGKSYVAFFDLDHTIIKKISGKALASGAYKKGVMTGSDLLRALFIYLPYKLRIREPMNVIEDMVGWVRGVPESVFDDLCSDVVRDILLPSVFMEAKNEIEIHKKKMAKVVILSSSVSAVCREISNTLEMDDIICSDLEVKDGQFTGRPLGQLCYGQEKVTRLTEYCQINNLDTAGSWYYGDSFSDLHVLSSVGHPVCVNPDNKLKKVAIRSGWKIVRWTH